MENRWAISGTISSAKNLKGVRATLYRLASTYLGYQDGTVAPFWYEGNDLQFRLLFESKQDADYFRRRLYDECLIHNSSFVQRNISQVSLTETHNSVGKEILVTDYNPDETDSPQNNISMVSGATSILDSSRPLFIYQRIESDSIFGQHYKADSCHLISKSYYSKNSHETDDVENNRLAMSCDVHCWYDGNNVDVPLFNLTISPPPSRRAAIVENRHEVRLLVTAYDIDSARLLFPRLKEGSEIISELQAIVSVFVLDPKIFSTCIEWKAAEIQADWDRYNSMSSPA